MNGKVIQEFIRYVGKEADGKTILSTSISNSSIDQIKMYGPLIALNRIAEEIGLSKLLGPYGNEILSMVFAHCLDYQSVNHMPKWFERTDLNMILNLEKLTEERLLDALDSLEIQNPDALQKCIFEKVKVVYGLNDKGIIYDVTNTYLYGKKCPWGKLGKDKENVKGRPLIQVGLGVTQDEGVPVFHKIFHGNIHDARTFQDLITNIRSYDIQQGIFVFDRGISSQQNQLDIDCLQWKVLCGLPLDTGVKKQLRALIGKRDFIQLKNRVRMKKKTVFYVETCAHWIGKVKGTLAFCFNSQKKQDHKESRYDELVYAEKLLNEGKPIKNGMEKYFDKNKMNMKKVKEAEEFDGYTAIFTTTSLSKEQMVRIYFDKDLVEKSFHSLKGIVHLRPIRHWLYNRVKWAGIWVIRRKNL